MSDELYAGAVRRIYRNLAWFGAAGALAAALRFGLEAAAGFGLGAVIAWVNFRWLHNVVTGLGLSGQTGAARAVVFGLRYLLFAGVAYAIMSFSTISGKAVVAGLLTLAAAVCVELIHQLIYASS